MRNGTLEVEERTYRRRVLIDLDVGNALDLVANAVRKQQCILFLGAGVHAPPPGDAPFEYPDEHRPAAGAGLSAELARGCGLAERFPGEDPANLQRVALFYEIAASRHQLVNAITGAVQTGKRPSPMLTALARRRRDRAPHLQPRRRRSQPAGVEPVRDGHPI